MHADTRCVWYEWGTGAYAFVVLDILLDVVVCAACIHRRPRYQILCRENESMQCKCDYKWENISCEQQLRHSRRYAITSTRAQCQQTHTHTHSAMQIWKCGPFHLGFHVKDRNVRKKSLKFKMIIIYWRRVESAKFAHCLTVEAYGGERCLGRKITEDALARPRDFNFNSPERVIFGKLIWRRQSFNCFLLLLLHTHESRSRNRK